MQIYNTISLTVNLVFILLKFNKIMKIITLKMCTFYIVRELQKLFNFEMAKRKAIYM